MQTVQDAEYEKRVRGSFAKQPFMTTIGALLLRVTPGAVDIELPFRRDLTQQNGFLHAGVLATVLDNACGFAAYTLMPPESEVLSIEFKINMLSPAIGDRLLAMGSVIRAGRTVTVCEAVGVMQRGDTEKIVAKMTGTMMTAMDMKKEPPNDN